MTRDEIVNKMRELQQEISECVSYIEYYSAYGGKGHLIESQEYKLKFISVKLDKLEQKLKETTK